ncbi:VOC family protein [Nocardioides sp. TF02-7]|uniref:VOC family protein n=1 Tax=Nocardioides sp. TF02-7 TaxID=2917724 RepID=UPI001F0578BD|nr:VOC family protein [Nocardioides sp. TF02-7]UMG94581.1 VOC family protein [Nocardioides sp. TF02-7]
MTIARDPSFVIDCPDPAALARFYAALLGWTASADDDNGWASVESGDRAFFFQKVEDYRAPAWPGQDVPQQVHLDVDVDNLDRAEQQTLELGATRHPHQPGETFRVFLDPAGHPFCLCLAG